MDNRFALIVRLAVIPLAILLGIGGTYWLGSGNFLNAVLLALASMISAGAAYTACRRRNDGSINPIGVGHVQWRQVVRKLSIIFFALISVVSLVVYVQDIDRSLGTLMQFAVVGIAVSVKIVVAWNS